MASPSQSTLLCNMLNMTTPQDLHSKLQGESRTKLFDHIANLEHGLDYFAPAKQWVWEASEMDDHADLINELTTSTINETLAWVREVIRNADYMGCGCYDPECKNRTYDIDDLLTLLEPKD